jgi:hypothetical protein
MAKHVYYGCEILVHNVEWTDYVFVLRDGAANYIVIAYDGVVVYCKTFDEAFDYFLYLLIEFECSRHLDVVQSCRDCSYFNRKDRFSYLICRDCERKSVCQYL